MKESRGRFLSGEIANASSLSLSLSFSLIRFPFPLFYRDMFFCSARKICCCFKGKGRKSISTFSYLAGLSCCGCCSIFGKGLLSSDEKRGKKLVKEKLQGPTSLLLARLTACFFSDMNIEKLLRSRIKLPSKILDDDEAVESYITVILPCI